MKIQIEISKEALDHAIEEVNDHTDECYTAGVPYPPSELWAEFQKALESYTEI